MTSTYVHCDVKISVECAKHMLMLCTSTQAHDNSPLLCIKSATRDI